MEIGVSEVVVGRDVAPYNFIFVLEMTTLKGPCSTRGRQRAAGFSCGRTICFNRSLSHQCWVVDMSYLLKPLFTFGPLTGAADVVPVTFA